MPTSKQTELEQLKEELRKEIRTQIEFEIKRSQHVEETQKAIAAKNGVDAIQKNKIVVKGTKNFEIESNSNGLEIIDEKSKRALLTISKSGAIGIGISGPRGSGKGSLHLRAWGTSEASIPSSGLNSTRGLIVEGDGDDDKTFAFRTVSRMNRQGFNVFSDGSLSVNYIGKIANATMGVYHKESDKPLSAVNVATKDFSDNVININNAADSSNRWNILEAVTDGSEDGAPHVALRISGTGEIYTAAVNTNSTGYAEMFEWADGNNNNENRNGIVVSFDKHGKLIPATEDNVAVGVVVPTASMIGNTMWNNHKSKFKTDEFGEVSTEDVTITEWLEVETGLLRSHYTSNLSENFALPENAIEIQTDENGEAIKKRVISNAYDDTKQYTSRKERKSWATICLLGSAPVYKGQSISPSWIKIRSIDDEIDLMVIK